MDSESLHLANKGLAERVESLSAQVAKQEKMIGLCLELIKQFGHFVPSIVKEFNVELDKIKGGEEDDQALSDELNTYVNAINPDHPEDLTNE